MAPEVIAGLLGAGSSMFSNIIDAAVARRNTTDTNKANRELAEYAYGKDVEMWNRQNMYNTPEMQMQRLKAAGLNPNLVYGSGSVVGNTSGQMPRYNAPTMQYNYRAPIDPFSTIAAYQDMNLRQAQIDNLKAQKRNTDQRTVNEGLNEVIKTGEASISQGLSENKLMKSLWDAEKSKLAWTGQWRRNTLLGYQADAQYLNNKVLSDMNSARLAMLRQSIITAQKENNWYTANALSSILTKALGAIGVGSIAGQMLRKPNTYNKYSETYIEK